MIAATVDTANGTRVGAYTFYLGGIAVGNEFIGKVDVAFEGEIIKRIIEFMGAWYCAKNE
jgi:hypothetical protein